MNLQHEVFGLAFTNPVILAAGTCGFGREVADVVDLDALGGFVTKSVTLKPRVGNPAPRVTEFAGGMLNSIGLANPGLDAVRRDDLPWIRANVRRAHVWVSVAGHTPREFLALVEGLEPEEGFVGFEVNLSCPNDTRRGGPPFALDPTAVGGVLEGVRARTDRPVLAKLAPNDPAPEHTARVAVEAGADGLTLANTYPGVLLHPEDGAPELGAGRGGVSGPALLPAGLELVRRVRGVVRVPIVGLGGILGAGDAVRYARAGAELVGIGTANFADPRAGERLVRGLERWGRRHGVRRWADLVAPPGGRAADPEPPGSLDDVAEGNAEDVTWPK